MKKTNNRTNKAIVIGLMLMFWMALPVLHCFAQQSFPMQEWPKIITIGTPSPGASTHILFVGLGGMITKYLKVRSSTQALGGSEPNVRAIGSRRTDMASIDAISMTEAAKGIGRFKEKIPVRLISNAFPAAMHIWTREDTGVKKFEDLKAKRFMCKSSTSRIANDSAFQTLKCYGFSYDDFVTINVSHMPEGTRALRDRTADAFWYPGILVPESHYTEMTMTLDSHLVPLGEKQMKCVSENFPYVQPGIIKGGVYKGVDKDVPALVFYNNLVAHRDLPDSLVYQIMNLIYEPKYREEFEKINTLAKIATREIALKNVLVPIHMGAVKWYKEHGLWIPELEKRQKELLKDIGESR